MYRIPSKRYRTQDFFMNLVGFHFLATFFCFLCVVLISDVTSLTHCRFHQHAVFTKHLVLSAWCTSGVRVILSSWLDRHGGLILSLSILSPLFSLKFSTKRWSPHVQDWSLHGYMGFSRPPPGLPRRGGSSIEGV